MSYIDEIIEKIKSNYPYLSSEFGVKKIGIFGSVAKDTHDEASDIDVVVEFEKPIGLKFIMLAEYMENLLGRKVDVLTKEGIRNIRVQNVSSDIKNNIIYV